MATDLDALIATEKGQKDALEKDISDGLAAQAKLAQVNQVLSDLASVRDRREAVADGAEARFDKAKAAATEATAALAPVDAMLDEAARKPTRKQLDDLVASTLPEPRPDPTKEKYADYVAALAAADVALEAAKAAAVRARDAEVRARLAIDWAEAALQAEVDRAVLAAAAAKAAAAEALKARASNDVGRAYWAQARAKALAGVVNGAVMAKAIADAEAALVTATNAFAEVVSARITAEAEIPKMQANRTRAVDQLGAASAKVLDRVLALVANPPPPVP